MNIFNLFTNKYFKYFFILLNIVIISALIYKIGYNKGKSDNQILQLKNINQIKDKYISELNFKQKQINDISYNLFIESSIQENKYAKISKELSIATINLNDCKFNNDSLRYLIKSTRMSNTGNSSTPTTIISGSSRPNTVGESGISNFSCRDLAQSYIKSNQMYFQCKALFDGWKQWYKVNFPS